MTRLPEDVSVGSGPRRRRTIRGAVVDARQVVVANGAVKVKHPFFRALVLVDVDRAVVDETLRCLSKVSNQRPNIADRIQGHIEDVSHRIPDRQRRHEWEDQIGAGANAIMAKRLSGIFIAALQVELILRYIGESTYPQR